MEPLLLLLLVMRRLEEIPLLLLILGTSAIHSAISPVAPMDTEKQVDINPS